MTSDSVTIKLTIKQVDFSDTGLYGCGMTYNGNIAIFDATYLRIEGNII